MQPLRRPRRLTTTLALVVFVAAGCSATASVDLADSDRKDGGFIFDSDVPVDDEPVDEVRATPAPAATSVPETAQTEPVEERPAPAPITAGENGCTYLGVDSFGDMQIELTFTSDVAEQQDALVSYAVNDGDVELFTSESFLEDLAPSERVSMQFDTVEDAPADDSNINCAYLSVESFDFGQQPSRPQSTDTCVFVEVDPVGDIQVRFDFDNPLPDAAELAVDYALRYPDGTRFGQGVAFVEPSGQTRLSDPEDTFTKKPADLAPSDVACDILAIESFG